LLDFCETRSIPVLGVCRGMQFMNVHYGGRLRPVANHVRTRHALQSCGNDLIMPADANSFHHYGLDATDLAPRFQPLALAPDQTIEAFTDSASRMLGIMWHPEREVPFRDVDTALLRQWFVGSVCA